MNIFLVPGALATPQTTGSFQNTTISRSDPPMSVNVIIWVIRVERT